MDTPPEADRRMLQFLVENDDGTSPHRDRDRPAGETAAYEQLASKLAPGKQIGAIASQDAPSDPLYPITSRPGDP